ncbi:MAG: glycosyltransferase [Actinomycetota bacterium]
MIVPQRTLTLAAADTEALSPPRVISPAGRALVLANLATAAFYVSWWFVPGRAGVPGLFMLLAGAEAFNLVHLLGLWWSVWSMRVDPAPPVHATADYSIDVLIPTCGEPLEVIERTVAGAIAMDVPHQTYVLDDARDPAVRSLAARLGARYIVRFTSRGAKAGNLNAALERTKGDLVAVFDADHVPHPEFLRSILGYFNDEQLAFVQTPQYYANAGGDEVARGAYLQQVIFYGPICRGKNGLNSAFCCGTNVLFRRKALEGVGGFDERSVVEDFVTSMRLHRAGWRSVYYPHVLAEGLGPTGVRAYFRQQFRWARGSIGALFTGEPFKRGFTLRQRVQYLLATTFYLIGLVSTIYLTLPILYLVGGWSALAPGSGDFVFFYAPYLLCAFLTLRWALGRRLGLDHIRYTFGAFPVYAAAAISAVLHLPARFRVTGRRARGGVPPLALLPLIAFAATAQAIVMGAFLRTPDARTVTTMSWAALNMLLLWGIVRVTLRDASRARARPPEPVTVPARLHRSFFPEDAVTPSVVFGARWSPARVRATVLGWTVVGLALRVAFAPTQGIRLDESLSLAQAQEPLLTLWRGLASGNVHIPLYHTLLHEWIKVAGTSEWALRAPSLLLGVAAIPLMHALGRRLFGVRAGIAAAALAALSPFWIWHSGEARMYPLVVVGALASTVLLVDSVRWGGARRWAAYALVTGVALYSHYFMLLLLPVHVGYLVLCGRRRGFRPWRAWAAATAGALALFAPWMWLLYTTRIQPSGVASLTNGVRLPAGEYTAYGIIYAFITFFVVFVGGYQATAVLATATAVVAGMWPLAIVRGTTARRRSARRRRVTVFLVAWIVFTVGGVFVANIAVPGLFFQKYLIIASPPVLLLIAARLSALRRFGLGLFFAAVVLLAATAAGALDPANPVREDFRAAAAAVTSHMSSGDAVVVLPGFDAKPFRYYFDGRVELVQKDDPPVAVVGERLVRVAELHQGNRLWVVLDLLYLQSADPDVPASIPRFLDLTYRRTKLFEFGRLQVSAYELPVE